MVILWERPVSPVAFTVVALTTPSLASFQPVASLPEKESKLPLTSSGASISRRLNASSQIEPTPFELIRKRSARPSVYVKVRVRCVHAPLVPGSSSDNTTWLEMESLIWAHTPLAPLVLYDNVHSYV